MIHSRIKTTLITLSLFIIITSFLSSADPIKANPAMSGLSLKDMLDTDLINNQLVNYDAFDIVVQSLPLHYNLAFKANVPVTCFMNPANIEDSRLLYMDWGSIYGIAPTASQVVMPQPYQSHRGQDWNSSVSQEPLYAIHSGVVTRASYDSSYGNRVDYTFGNWTVYYAHLSTMNVSLVTLLVTVKKLAMLEQQVTLQESMYMWACCIKENSSILIHS